MGWAIASAVVMVAAGGGAAFVGRVNDRADQDEPLARAECAEYAGGSAYRLEWRFGMRPGWECSWLSTDDREGGGFLITWNAYADR